MKVSRANSGLFLAVALFTAAAGFASIPSQPPLLEPEFPSFDTTEDSDLEPEAIPNSAVASSDNCTRLATMQQEFEHGIVTQDLNRVQGPEQDAPLGVSGKFRLAVANVSDPFAVMITALDSEFGNAAGPASPLPRGADGFGERFGISMAGQASSEFFSTFLVSSIFHQDPHYHRDPDAATKTRIGHALSYVVITRSDSGKRMFNFAEFLGTASSSIVEGAIHPEWKRDAGASAQRIFISIGSDAAWNLMTEFLPDVAKHLNPRFLLLRRLAEKAAAQN
ncbi:MAG TPA: hypothetical protein VG498_02215 [Terriglobales bacterium]|nr:hypothetical protein [Terriglobales bacterium]